MVASDFTQQFADRYDGGESQIVWRRIVADLETPIGTYLKLAQDRRNTFLLESVQDGSTRGRYSIIGLLPDVILKVEQGTASINRQAQLDATAFEPLPDQPLDALRHLVADSQISVPEGLPPQSAGIYGFLGYEMVRYMEVLPDSNPDDLQLPEAMLMRPS
ncbi:MAG: trpE, partial [Devosia sp.]|nr:trpE [Devosia sp.]